MRYFVTAIGTNSGKTLMSAILVAALKGNYWKPVQAGSPTDTDTVRKWLGNKNTTFFNEAYFLEKPASPHDAAAEEGIAIAIKDIIIPESDKPLIIEGAGGVMVPLNEHELMVDLIQYLKAEVILVADLYLGSINHTLLTIQFLKQMGCKIKGIVFNGIENKASMDFILNHSQIPLLLHIKPENEINRSVINQYALTLLKNWKNE